MGKVKNVGISRKDGKAYLCVGSKRIKIEDYETRVSEDGKDELCVAIKGNLEVVEYDAPAIEYKELVDSSDQRMLENLGIRQENS